MSERALYRMYRSTTLNDVVGQDHITKLLAKSLAAGHIAHAYLLTGPRGVGKTSVARILAHQITKLPYTNEDTHLDIIEIDAASRSGVEDIRELLDKVPIAPVVADKKVYIIDEVHMLSKSAFNALLKTLEEPPMHVVFIFATTDPEKIPPTIISRTQQFHFHLIQPPVIAKHLRTIAEAEQINIDDEALLLLAERAEGGFRDAITMLDQVAGFSEPGAPITHTDIESLLGLAPRETVMALLASYPQDPGRAIELLFTLREQGISPQTLLSQLLWTIQQELSHQLDVLPLLTKLLRVRAGATTVFLELAAIFGQGYTQASRASQPPQSPEPENAPRQDPPQKSSQPTTQITQASVATAAQHDTARPEAQPPTTQEATGQPQRPAEATKPQEVEVSAENTAAAAPDELDWPAVLTETRQLMPALAGILSRSHMHYDKPQLTIYAGTKFFANKLADSKYLQMIHKALQQLGAEQVNVTISAEAKPPSDPKLAAIATLMGGGTEITLEEEIGA